MLIIVACETSKQSVATIATPQSPQSATMPQKSMGTESDKTPLQSKHNEKKTLPQKGLFKPVQGTPDTANN